MGRIEDAIAKVHARSSRGAQQRPLARLSERPRPGGAHGYGGRQIEIDFPALRVQGLIAPDNHERRLTDEYRVIKRPLINNASPTREHVLNRGNLLMVGSATAGEGKTFTCINLCLSIAREKDWTVVIVDADCAKPHVTRLFAAQGERGLLDLLRDPQLTASDLIMPTNVDGLALLPAGTQDEDAAELLASTRMAQITEQLSVADPYRMIVFDSSPLLQTTESLVLSQHVGQIVMVVHAETTPQQVVLAALSKLDGTKAVNLILNQVSTSSGGGEYGYGYGDNRASAGSGGEVMSTGPGS